VTDLGIEEEEEGVGITLDQTLRAPTHTHHQNPSRFVRTKLSHALPYLQPSSPSTGSALIGRPRREDEQTYPLRAMVFSMRLPLDPVNCVGNDLMRSGRSIRMIPQGGKEPDERLPLDPVNHGGNDLMRSGWSIRVIPQGGKEPNARVSLVIVDLGGNTLYLRLDPFVRYRREVRNPMPVSLWRSLILEVIP
jgi:hypothetical protein